MITKSLTLTGTSAQATVTTDTAKAKWVQLLADSTNGAAINIGGAEVSNSVGFPLAAGASQFFPSISDMMEFYQLAMIYFYASSGDKLHVLFGVEGQNS